MPETLTFDHYEVLTRDDGAPFELGRGAMGITYKAFDTNLRIPVALKVINATYLNSEVARQRFIREARSAAKLRHRHVASVFHLGINGDAYFYAMEFIDGETVDALIKRQGPLAPAVALKIAGQVARALNAAQPHGLVHRDIKPANLMLVREDDDLVVKVIDFGLAKTCVPGEAEDDAATLSMGGFVGTPHFASPEQLDEKEIDVRSDIYSLGVTLWYMLSGQTPFAGSMAQVMSQHLSKPPPFERLADLPPPLSKLLERMLAKDPADRPQTPLDLRREIEECGDAIAQGSPAAARAEVEEENFATLLEDPAKKAAARFEAGQTVAGRYEIIENLGETNTGRLFHAQDLGTSRDVRLLVLNRDLTADSAAYTQIEREVERTAAVQHPNLLRIYGIEAVDGASFITMEWTDGFTLVELLRARRELNATEVLALLPQAADGIDHALSEGLKRLDLALHQTFVHFTGEHAPKAELLRRPVETWPPFVLKFNPLGVTRELSLSETWAGRQTIVGGIAGQSGGDSGGGGDVRARYIQAIATIVYELLGGTLAPFAFGAPGAPRYTPIATLSEEGNDVLRRALDPAQSFPSAYEFQRALSALKELELKRRDTKAGSTTPDRAMASHSSTTIEPFVLPERKRAPIGLIAGIAVIAVAGAGFYFHSHSGGKSDAPTSLEDRPSETSDPANEPTPPSPPPPDDNPPSTPPSPPPQPTRQELLKAAVNAADELEANEKWPEALTAWLKVAADFPESEVGKTHLEIIMEKLRGRSEEPNPKEFTEVRQMITEAAQLDIVSAMLFLGDGLRKSDPVTAFNWYSAAAARGQAPAMRQLGLMLANGAAGTRDLDKAFYYFEQAAEKGDVAGKYLLGECYLRGNGVKKDEKRAVSLLTEAADAGNLFAMDLLGTCYHQGLGVEKDFGKALQLFTTASERGYAVATGNLGVLYIKGDGLPKPNPQKAVELFQKGIRAGDGNCMYFYALCLETGVGVGTNLLQAQSWYKKAAEAGNKLAADWCRKKGVPFDAKPAVPGAN